MSRRSRLASSWLSLVALGNCTCGEPVFRHRSYVDGRQISCSQLRRLDRALQALPGGPVVRERDPERRDQAPVLTFPTHASESLA